MYTQKHTHTLFTLTYQFHTSLSCKGDDCSGNKTYDNILGGHLFFHFNSLLMIKLNIMWHTYTYLKSPFLFVESLLSMDGCIIIKFIPVNIFIGHCHIDLVHFIRVTLNDFCIKFISDTAFPTYFSSKLTDDERARGNFYKSLINCKSKYLS